MRNIHLKATALVATATAALLAAAPAQATIVFADDFDSYSPSVPWNGSGVWNIGGSVDLVANNSFNLTCVGGAGNCVDLTGSAPGAISKGLTLAPGTYQLSFAYTGNQLDAFGGPWPQSGINFSIGSLTGSVGPLTNNSTAFATYTGNFTVTGAEPVTLSFSQQPGGDTFRGSILDAVSISSVPEPGTWALMFLGFGMIGFAMRRRRQEARLRFAN